MKEILAFLVVVAMACSLPLLLIYRRRQKRPKLTDTQVFYKIVKELVRNGNGMSFDHVNEFLNWNGWQFSGGFLVPILEKFADETHLVSVSRPDHWLEPTPLAFNPDDRTITNMAIEYISQMENGDRKDIWFDGVMFSPKDLVDEMRRLTPYGVKFARRWKVYHDREYEEELAS